MKKSSNSNFPEKNNKKYKKNSSSNFYPKNPNSSKKNSRFSMNFSKNNSANL